MLQYQPFSRWGILRQFPKNHWILSYQVGAIVLIFHCRSIHPCFFLFHKELKSTPHTVNSSAFSFLEVQGGDVSIQFAPSFPQSTFVSLTPPQDEINSLLSDGEFLFKEYLHMFIWLIVLVIRDKKFNMIICDTRTSSFTPDTSSGYSSYYSNPSPKGDKDHIWRGLQLIGESPELFRYQFIHFSSLVEEQDNSPLTTFGKRLSIALENSITSFLLLPTPKALFFSHLLTNSKSFINIYIFHYCLFFK